MDSRFFCTPERSLIAGELVIRLEPLACGSEEGDRDNYTRDIPEFDGEPEFFLEFRVETDGDRSEIDFAAPANIAAASSGSVRYNFTITRDLVRFIRDAALPIQFIKITPDVMHTYRLELFTDQLYVFYIDDEVADSGVPEGPYPSSSPRLPFLTGSAFLKSTTRWDYIRFGKLPADGSGDFDSNALIDAFDMHYFGEYFSGKDIEAGPGGRWADLDSDTDVDCVDFAQFETLWTAPGDPPTLAQCAPVPAVSTWGLAVLSLLTLSAGTILITNRRHQHGTPL